MLKIYNTDLNTNEFRRLNDFEIGCWVHLENPNEEEIEKVSSSLGIKKDFLVSILDDDEKPRIDEEEGTSKRPPHPYLRPAAESHKGEWRRILEEELKNG